MPQISIVIPTKNREIILEKNLEHIYAAGQDDLEVIVVNDGEAFERLKNTDLIHLVNNPNKGVSGARNHGASLASSDLLFFLDDDMLITPATIDAILKLKKEGYFSQSALVMNWEYPKDLINTMSNSKVGRYYLNSKYHTLAGRLGKAIEQNTELFKMESMGSASFLISKDNFQKIGRYNENIGFQGEDIDLSNRLRSNELPVNLYVPVTCYHNDPIISDIDQFLDRQYRGFFSEFQAIKAGIIKRSPNQNTKEKIYTILSSLYGVLKFVLRCIPNKRIFDPMSFRLINMLSSIQKYRAKKHAERL